MAAISCCTRDALAAHVQSRRVDREDAARLRRGRAPDDDGFFLLQVEQRADVDGQRLAVLVQEPHGGDERRGVGGVGQAEGAFLAGCVLMAVLLSDRDGFGVDEKEHRRGRIEGELRKNLRRGIRHAAHHAYEHHVPRAHFGRFRVVVIGVIVVRVIVGGMVVACVIVVRVVFVGMFVSGDVLSLGFFAFLVRFGLLGLAFVLMVVGDQRMHVGLFFAQHGRTHVEYRLGAVGLFGQRELRPQPLDLGLVQTGLSGAPSEGGQARRRRGENSQREDDSMKSSAGKTGGRPWAARKRGTGRSKGKRPSSTRECSPQFGPFPLIVGFLPRFAKIAPNSAKSVVARHPAGPRAAALASRKLVSRSLPGRPPGPILRRAKAMLKKLVIVGLVVVGLGVLFAGTNLGSYVSTAYRRTADTVEDTVPMEFQIDRARNMVRDLEPEIRRSMHVIAKEEVEVAELDKRIAAAEDQGRQGQDRNHAAAVRPGNAATARSATPATRYTDERGEARTWPAASTASRRPTPRSTACSRCATPGSRNLDAARQKLTAMMAAQRQLQVEVENLEAKLKLVQVAEASSDFQFDDSQLARCKELMTDIRTRLDVAAKLANADTNVPGRDSAGRNRRRRRDRAGRRVLRPRGRVARRRSGDGELLELTKIGSQSASAIARVRRLTGADG